MASVGPLRDHGLKNNTEVKEVSKDAFLQIFLERNQRQTREEKTVEGKVLKEHSELSDLVPLPTISEEYCTKSKYIGPVDKLGFSGQGVYTYPHGVIYKGNFQNGHFHGKGTLIYPSNLKMEGTWYKGRLKKHQTVLPSGLKHDKHNWNYLHMPNRLFPIEEETYLRPPNHELISAQEVAHKCPPQTYDMADHTYYDAKQKIICSEDGEIQRIVKQEETEFIPNNFRQNLDMATGYRPCFYEDWCSGRAKEVQDITNKYINKTMSTPTSMASCDDSTNRSEDSNHEYILDMDKTRW